MMKNLFKVAGLAVALLIGACGEKRQANELKFVLSADYPPYEFYQKGELVGFDVDLARLVAKELGKTAAFQEMQFSGLLASVDHGHADAAISSLEITPERSQNFDFSTPYYFASLLAVFKAGAGITKPSDLAGRKVACQLGSTMEIWLKKNVPEAHLVSIDANTVAIESLKAGHVDVVVMDDASASAFMNKNEGLASIPVSQSDAGCGVLVKKGSLLLAPINKALNDLQVRGELAKLKQKWFQGGVSWS